MKISIFGLGYVGCVSAGCLAGMGHTVIGVDPNPIKIRQINEGKPTIIEKDIEQLIKQAHDHQQLFAIIDVEQAVLDTEISIISVGTPSTKNGHLNLEYIYNVAREIGQAIKKKEAFHVVTIRSTVLPGTNQKVGEIIEQESGKQRNKAFTVVSNPEFLREGTAVHDYYNPPLTLVGTDHELGKKKMEELYKKIPGEKVFTDIEVAELMKYVNNTYHALKIVFGNEVGNICKALNIDSHKVMEIFCMDKQLNISPYYFKPGFAYGGSCLPKDSKALKTLASELFVNTPVINNIHQSNEIQKENALEIIMSKKKHKIGILGLSFKAGTDDLRNSPIVDVVERLLGKGYALAIYDKHVKLSELTGTNKEYIESKIPHLQRFITNDLDQVMQESEVIVVTNKEREFEQLLENYPNKIIIDLVRMWKTVEYEGDYEGLCWGNVNEK